MPEIAQTADHALRILEELGEGEPLSLQQLSIRLGLSKSAVHRLLVTLSGRGFVLRTNDTYEPGGAVLRIAEALKPDLRFVAADVLLSLSTRLDETVVLHAQDNLHAVVIDQAVASRQLVQVSHRIGSRHPLSVGASGRAILAYLDPKVRRRAAAQVADHAQLERSLAEIRGSGVALSHDEIQADVYGIAAAIRDGTRVFGSLGILVPVSRAGGLTQLAGTLVAAAERIAEAMRGRGTGDSAKSKRASLEAPAR